ncbi:MAG: helix-hairpin-helix domain-containing protein [Snowella sp.]|nr:helix-hairpin-helix domain-containing protein [Snowella sp.]
MKKYRYLYFLAILVNILVLSACNENKSPAPSAIAPSLTASDHGGMSHSMETKININNAILSQLDKLEAKLGIPALSNKIQASRPYGSIEELVSKNVLTQEQLDQIKDTITVEDIVLEGEAKDIDYMIKLGLMKGHLLVAQELLAQNKPEQAEPHIGHPIEEIYADVEDQLNERKVSEFKTNLISLQNLVKAGGKDKAKVDTAFKTSMQAIDNAIAVLPEKERQSPGFILPVINGLLDTANSEYGASVSKGKIAAPIEYQDSRGFVIYADQLYQSIAPQIKKANSAGDKLIQANFIILKKVWPSAVPPSAPVKTPQQVTELIKAIETTSKPLAEK